MPRDWQIRDAHKNLPVRAEAFIQSALRESTRERRSTGEEKRKGEGGGLEVGGGGGVGKKKKERK